MDGFNRSTFIHRNLFSFSLNAPEITKTLEHVHNPGVHVLVELHVNVAFRPRTVDLLFFFIFDTSNPTLPASTTSQVVEARLQSIFGRVLIRFSGEDFLSP
jgi:hypothetical protein